MVLALFKNRYNDWQQKAEQSKKIHVYFTDILLIEYHNFLFVLQHKHVPFFPKTPTASKAIFQASKKYSGSYRSQTTPFLWSGGQ